MTKEGAVAGPRVLEHLVDCVLLFEGERERSYRTLRALKNRFGATSELGVFEMRSAGLVEVEDPSARFVGEATAAAGSVVLCAMEGTRPLLVEVQALVAPTEVVPPRRVANGIDRNRLAMILAVLSRHGGVGIGGADVFVNVAGGVRVDEPGADLAIALAIASAHRGEPLSDPEGRPLACFGEVGLTGELRYVAHAERRVAEALKFGLSPVLGPQIKEAPQGLEPASTLRAALAGARKRPATRATRSAKPPDSRARGPSGRPISGPSRYGHSAGIPHTPTSGVREPRLGASLPLGRLDLAVLGRRARDEAVEQALGRRGDLLDRTVEDLLVGLRGLRRSADLADELERRVMDLVVARGRLEIVECSDVPAHGRIVTGPCALDKPDSDLSSRNGRKPALYGCLP